MDTNEKTISMNNEFGEPIKLKGRQVECVNYSGASSLLIKGTAGSGKTLILAKIAKNLLEDNPPINGKPQICIYVYTTSLHDAMAELLEANGIRVAKKPGDEGEIAVYSIKKYIAHICYKLGTVPRNFRPITDNERLRTIEEILENYRKYPYHHNSYDLDAEFWADELKWMYTNGIADESDRTKYLSMDRKGRCKKYKTRMTDSGRRAAFDMMVMYNNTLYDDKRYEWDRVHALCLKKLESCLKQLILESPIDDGSLYSGGIDDETEKIIQRVVHVQSLLDPDYPSSWAEITDDDIRFINNLAIRIKDKFSNDQTKLYYDYTKYSANNPLLPTNINKLLSTEVKSFSMRYDVPAIRTKIGMMKGALRTLAVRGIQNDQKTLSSKRAVLKNIDLADYLQNIILVDECQDVSLVDMKIFACMNVSPKMYIAMDRNQSLYGYQWSFKRDAGINTSVKKLDMTFRSTKQIDEFANDLKRIDDQSLEEEDRYENLVSNIEGALPRIVGCRNKAEENDYILSLINAFAGKNMTTAIIVPNKTLVRQYYALVSEQTKEPVCIIGEEGATIMKPGVKISTIHKAKGLGFSNVIVPSFNKGTYPKSEEILINSIKKRKKIDASSMDSVEDALREEISDYRKLAYVAITRSKMNLIITYVNPSPFISEFDEKHYELLNASNQFVEDTRISKTSTISSEDESKLSKALERSSIKQRYESNRGSSPSGYRNMKVAEAIKMVGLEDRLIDNTGSKGNIYVLGGPEISSQIEELKKMGFKFEPTIPVKATGNKKAWIYKGKYGYVCEPVQSIDR